MGGGFTRRDNRREGLDIGSSKRWWSWVKGWRKGGEGEEDSLRRNEIWCLEVIVKAVIQPTVMETVAFDIFVHFYGMDRLYTRLIYR